MYQPSRAPDRDRPAPEDGGDSIVVLYVDAPDAADAVAPAIAETRDDISVATAAATHDAWAHLERHAVDCVVSGYDVPGEDGLALLRAVREEHDDLPFVLFVEEGSEALAREAISAGVTEYLRRTPVSEQVERLADAVVDAVHEHRAARATRHSERRLRELVETTDDVLWMFSRDWDELLFVNSAYERMWGQSVDALAADPRDFLAGIHPEDRDEVERAMERVSAGESVEIEYRVAADGESWRWVWVRGEPVFDDGNVVRVAGFSRDITRRRHHERTLEQLHDATRELMGAESRSGVAEIVVATARDLLDLPITGCWLYDEAADALRPAATTSPPEFFEGAPPTYREGEGLSWAAFETGEMQVYDDVSAHPDRYNDDTSVRAEMILPLGEHGVVNVGATESGAFDETTVSLAQLLAANAEAALDCAEREATLRTERAFVDQALDTLDDVFYVFGPDGRALRWNDRLAEVTGYADDEITEMQPADFFAAAHRDRISAAVREVFETGHVRVEADLLTNSGERVPYELTGTRLADADGEVVGFVGVGRDIAERRERERALERQNERLEQFASIVSHDLRNPLNVAQGRVELARHDCDSDHLDAAVNAHDRMEELIEDLLALARGGTSSTGTETVDLAATVEACWRNVDTDDATLVVETDSVIRGDPGQLQQLVENLARNSVEHGGTGVTVTVGDLDDGFYVEDDGTGIPSGERERVFESGYSTADDGTGFGLDIVEQVAEAHGWDVTLTESAGGGARFEITGVERERTE